MTDKTAVPETLASALAIFQASLPKIAKGETANVRSDKGNYSYKYADLTDISSVILPRLGELGLSFTARPTLSEGMFCLAYSLKHVSGESDDGVYPLPASGTPQSIGSAITYARRYCLCAVTGVAPGGDDDDAAAAQSQVMNTGRQRTAADAFESAAPAMPRNRQQPVREPSQQARQDAQPPVDEDQDWGDWTDTVNGLSTIEDCDKADAELKELFKADKIGPGKASAIRAAILAKRDQFSAGHRVPA